MGVEGGKNLKSTNFNNVVKDCLKKLRKFGSCICFNEEQYLEIKKRYDGEVEMTEDEMSFFYITSKDKKFESVF